jgi:predicted GIY-YIG superfamily endonuclease
MHYVYLLESVSAPGQRYVGVTSDLKRRLGRVCLYSVTQG